MKVRNDFVTNSSSSSFIIAKRHLDEDQMEAIRQYDSMMEKLHLTDDTSVYEPWEIDENDKFISGYTFQDNLPISALFTLIDIPDSIVIWGEFRFDLDGDDYDNYPHDESQKGWRELLHEDSN